MNVDDMQLLDLVKDLDKRFERLEKRIELLELAKKQDDLLDAMQTASAFPVFNSTFERLKDDLEKVEGRIKELKKDHTE